MHAVLKTADLNTLLAHCRWPNCLFQWANFVLFDVGFDALHQMSVQFAVGTSEVSPHSNGL